MDRMQQVAASILALGLCGLAVAAPAWRLVPKGSVEESAPHRVADPHVVAAEDATPAILVADASPGLALLVEANAELPEVQARRLLAIRDRLNRAKIGATRERVLYFQQFAAQHPVPIGEWRGAIELVTPTPNGILIDIAVSASYGSGETDTATLMERYSIVDDVVGYVGSWVPKNRIRFVAGG